MQNIIVPAMAKIDPFLRFLTKATGKTSVPIKLLQQVLPKSNDDATVDASASESGNDNADQTEKTNGGDKECDNSYLSEILIELTYRGVLNYEPNKSTVGFPLPPSPSNSNVSSTTKSTIPSAVQKPPSKLKGKGLHGSTEPAAKRRMKVLRWTLERVPSWICRKETDNDSITEHSKPEAKGKKRGAKSKNDSKATKNKKKRTEGNTLEISAEDEEDMKQPYQDITSEVDERLDECDERRAAYQALDALLRGSGSSVSENKGATVNGSSDIDKMKNTKQWLPSQASYAGSQPGREVRYGTLSKETVAKIPPEILQLFDLDSNSATLGRQKRRLFLHQSLAIESAMDGVHTVVQTATGR